MLQLTTALATAAVFAGGVAHAVTLSTPLVRSGSGRISQCIVTNIGPRPTVVTIAFYDSNGGPIVPTSDSCVLSRTLALYTSCSVQAPAGQVAACVVQSSRKTVCAALEVFDAAGIVAVVPATAK